MVPAEFDELDGGTVRCPTKRQLLLLSVGAFLVADVTVARLTKLATVSDYRIASSVYHHDLAKMVAARGAWLHTRYPLRTNSLGFRDLSNRAVALTSDRHRIVLMGDGFTEGLGFAYELTFAGLITKALGKRQIEVLNAAAISYAPTIYYRKTKYLLETVGLRFDELVAFIDMTDVRDEALFYELDADDRVISNAPFSWGWSRDARTKKSSAFGIKAFLKRNSAVIRWLIQIRDAQAAAPPPPSPPQSPQDWSRHVSMWTIDDAVFEEFGRAGLVNAARHMEMLLTVLRAYAISLSVVVYPWPDQVFNGDRDSKQVAFWREWCNEHEVRFYDLFPRFFEGGNGEELLTRYYNHYDAHFNERGHRLVATEFLARYAVPASHVRAPRQSALDPKTTR